MASTPSRDLVDRQVYRIEAERPTVGVYRAAWAELVTVADGHAQFDRRGIDTERGNVPPVVIEALPFVVPESISLDPRGPLLCSETQVPVTRHDSAGGAVITYRHPDHSVCAHVLTATPNRALLEFLTTVIGTLGRG